MATKLSGAITAQDTPTIVFTAYEDFWLKIDIDAGTNTIKLQVDLLDDLDWQDLASYTASGIVVIDVPIAMKFRLVATTFQTGPINWAVHGKLNANDTIYDSGSASPGAYVIEEAGDDVLEEDGSSKVLEEAA